MNLLEIKEQLKLLRRKKPDWSGIDRLTTNGKTQLIEDLIDIYLKHKNDFSHEEKQSLHSVVEKNEG